MVGSDHLDSKHEVFKRTSDGGFMTESNFEPVPKLPVIVQGVCDGGEEKRSASPREGHVESCQHRRGEGEKKSKGKWGK